jgi:microcystin-dependent protein
MPTTDLYGLPFPTDDLPADVPTDIEALARAIDRTAGLFFPGDLKLSAAQNAPTGWLVCDGRAVDRDLYPELFDAIGVAYGNGDGVLTFNLPNFIDRFAMGATSDRRGVAGGAAAVALTVAELAHHTHVPSDPGHLHGGGGTTFFVGTNTGAATTGAQSGPNFGAITAGDALNIYTDHRAIGLGIFGEGGNAAHNNMPPYLGVNVFIKT